MRPEARVGAFVDDAEADPTADFVRAQMPVEVLESLDWRRVLGEGDDSAFLAIPLQWRLDVAQVVDDLLFDGLGSDYLDR